MIIVFGGRTMNYILLMTCAGSLLFVGYLLLEKAMGKRMSQPCRYGMLAASLFGYLVPWVWMRGIYGAVRVPSGKDSVMAVSGRLVVGDAVLHTTDEIAVTQDFGLVLYIAGVWLVIAVLAMLMRCWIYFYSRHNLLTHAGSCETDVPEELVQRLKKEFRIRRRVRIVQIPDEAHSFTLGIFKPVVFLQKSYSPEELEYILRHEFIHISRGDLLVKMLMQLVCCLHWFNPLVYCLNRRLDRACEQACDERVTRDMSEDECVDYAHLIVRSMRESGKQPKRKMFFMSFLASNEKFAEERIRIIMNKRKIKLWEKIVVAGIFGVLVFADSLTAMAYPNVYHLQDAPAKLAGNFGDGTSLLSQKVDEHSAETFDDVILYDEQIITADGEILPVPEQTRVLCFHKWEDAMYEFHLRDDNGGCTTDVYYCKYCPRCNTIKVGDYYATHTYAVCPHDYD